jgi:hypothetical protein
MYYISEVLHDAKTRYLEVHKLLYAILITSRKLRNYFQAHRISVVSSYPLRVILHNPNATDNITKWTAELAEFELDFVLRHEIKSQMFTDFIVDWTPPASHPGGPDVSEPGPRAPVFTEPHLTLFFDGSHKQGAGARYWSSPLRGAIQVYGAPGLQRNQQHGGVQSPALWVKHSVAAGGATAPHERRLPAHH